MVTVNLQTRPGEVPGREHGRAVFVIENLGELHGPANGTVTLPLQMSWTRREAFQLDDADDRASFYELVLQEAKSDDDLRLFLNADVLKREWKDIFLPKHVRAAWEFIHPDFSAARGA